MQQSGPAVDISDIERHCEAAGFGDYDWHDLLGEITTWVGGDKAMLLGANSQGSLMQTLSFNHDPANIRRYNAGYNLLDPRRGHSLATRVGSCGLGQGFVPNEAIKNTAYFADIAEYGDVQDSVHGIIVDDPELGRHSISVQRGFAHEYFQPKEAERLKAVLPMIGTAMRASQRILSLQSRRQPGGGQFYCLVRRDLGVHFIEDPSRPPAYLADETGIALTRTGWVFGHARLRSAFALAVDRATEGRDVSFTFRGVRFAFSPPPINLGWLVGGVKCALLLIGRLDSVAHQAALLFAHAFKFTPRETDVLSELAEGLDVRQAAQRVGIDYETARWHLKNMCAKAGYRKSRSLIEDARAGDLSRIY